MLYICGRVPQKKVGLQIVTESAVTLCNLHSSVAARILGKTMTFQFSRMVAQFKTVCHVYNILHMQLIQ